MILEKIATKSTQFITEGLNLTAKSFGFHEWDSMNNYIFLIVNKSMTLMIFIFSFTIGVSGWVENWIFAPVYTYMVFISLMLAEISFGTIKAMYIDKEKFNWDKFGRIMPKLIAHTFALSAAFHMAKAEPLFLWMPSSIFIFFSIQNFMKCLLHLIALKSLDGSVADFMRSKFSQNNDFIPTDINNEDKQKGHSDPS
jgi:hypothetical protein